MIPFEQFLVGHQVAFGEDIDVRKFSDHDDEKTDVVKFTKNRRR